MSDDMSRPAVAPDTAAIDANNEIVDRLVAGFETPLYRFLRHHRGKAHLLAFLLAVVWATPRFPQVLLGLPLIVIGLGIRAWASGCSLTSAWPSPARPTSATRRSVTW